jgi:hypothetical protein
MENVPDACSFSADRHFLGKEIEEDFARPAVRNGEPQAIAALGTYCAFPPFMTPALRRLRLRS